ncbi:MAG: transglycosylase domain-containing protein [Bacteroidales bacterium]
MKYKNLLLWGRLRLHLFLLLVLVVLLIVGLLRTPLLRWYADRKISRFNERYQCSLKVDGLSFSGLASMHVRKILLINHQGDTLIGGEELKVNLGFWNLVKLSFRPNSIEVEKLTINGSYQDGRSNWDFLFRSSVPRVDTQRREPPDIARRAQFFSRLFFDFLPASTHLLHFQWMVSYQGIPLKIVADSLHFSDQPFSNRLVVSDDSTDFSLRVNGYLNRKKHQGEVTMYPDKATGEWLPFLPRAADTRMAIDTLRLWFRVYPENASIYRAELAGEGVHLRVANPALSDEIVSLSETRGRVGFIIQKNCIEIDTGAYAEVNGLRIPFSARLCLNPHPVVQLKIQTGWFPAQRLFDALPKGLFYNLQGMKVKGELAYTMDFRLDTRNPDSLWFESRLDRRGFFIQSFGRTPLSLMNGSFLYTAYEKGIPVRSFVVGSENPGFVPLDQIPLHLRYAVMTSEDGGFYQHNGFLPDAFREAMIANIKAGRFVRGGSTISMQLVKNVFLNRHKTITRKLEEALIVWLIENQRLTSKDRMFEVYLNIIEWGPLVYGIKEASRFYFNKRPAALTLAESVFLAGIIPSPKNFMYYLNSEGRPRPFLQNYFQLMGNKMLAKGFITEDMLPQLDPNHVKITGEAFRFIPQADTLPSDSIWMPLPIKEVY